MTKKQDNILNAALELFSKEGFHATSTSKIAQVADVSEGLVFRHFINKEGLLNVLLAECQNKINTWLNLVLNEQEPKQLLSKILMIPFDLDESDIKYWKLLLKLNWEIEGLNIQPFAKLHEPLLNTFKVLRYRNPLQETEFLLQLLKSYTGSVIQGTITNKVESLGYLYRKYHLE